jgi:hypothetical protein
MITVFAALGAKSLYLLYVWLGSAIVAQYLSERKGYGEKAGLVTGLLISFLAVIVWLVWPARKDSRWKLQGAFGKGDGRTVAQMRADAGPEEGDG